LKIEAYIVFELSRVPELAAEALLAIGGRFVFTFFRRCNRATFGRTDHSLFAP
jgi:hypothetical protein